MIRTNTLPKALFTLFTFILSSVSVYSAEFTVPAWGHWGAASISGTTFSAPPDGDNGFYVDDTSNYPLSFSEDGQITVNASVPDNTTANLRFQFQYQPYPNTDPNFEVTIPITGSATDTYTATLPAQGANTFSNIVLFIDKTVSIQDVQIVSSDVDTPVVVPGEAPSTVISGWEPFGGSGATLVDNVLTDPKVQPWAGFNAVGTNLYPFTFKNDGTIQFTARLAEAGPSASVYFVLESGDYPNHKPVYSTLETLEADKVYIDSTEDKTYTINIDSSKIYNYNEFHGIRFFIETADVGVILGDVTVNDDAYATRPSFDNGVRFVLLDKPHSGNVSQDTDIFLATPWVEVNSSVPSTYSVTLPAYAGEVTGFGANTLFSDMNIYLAGRDQAMIVRDVTVSVGSNSYGGSGSDSIVFGNAFQFDRAEEDTNGDGEIDSSDDELYTFYHSSKAADWGGAAATGNPFGTSGALMNETITVTFTAALSDYEFDDPYTYTGEVAFGDDGSINTAVDTAPGTDDEPRRWSAYLNWFGINEDGTQQADTLLGGDSWNNLSLVQANWSEVDGESILTLKPNTASFYVWQQPGETDGNRYLVQEVRIEGTYPDTGSTITENSKILGKTVNFAGTVNLNSLDLSRYTVTAFIRCKDISITDGSDNVLAEATAELDNTGQFSLSVDMPQNANSEGELLALVPSLGFILEGRNASPENYNHGEIQIKDIVAYWTEINPLNGDFNGLTDFGSTSGSSNYWSAGTNTVALFNNNNGVGTIPGQLQISGNTRGTRYVASNQGSAQNLSDLGMVTNATYELSYNMLRAGIPGTDLGLVQVTFYDSSNNEISSIPSDPAANLHTDTTSGQWAEYSQSISTPANAAKALFKIYSAGSGTLVSFDDVSLALTGYAPIFSNWAQHTHGLSGADAAFNADPDNDGIANGLENLLGTDPSAHSSGGMSNIAKTTDGLSMQHSKNSAVSNDVTANYEWSTDLSTWNASGATVGGSTVSITAADNTPTTGTTTATATVSGTELDTVFIKVSASNE